MKRSQLEGGGAIWARPKVLVAHPILFGCSLVLLMDHTANATAPASSPERTVSSINALADKQNKQPDLPDRHNT